MTCKVGNIFTEEMADECLRFEDKSKFEDLVKQITDDITMVADDFRTYGDSYEASILDGVVDFILSKYGDGPADPEYIRNRMLDDATFHNTDI